MTDAGVFVGLDTASNILATKQMYSKRRAFEATAETPTKDVLSPSAAANLTKLHELMQAGKKTGASIHVAGDVSQDPRYRHRAGNFVPTLMKSSQIVCLTADDHIYTSNELSFAHGYPTVSVSKPEHRWFLNFDLMQAACV